MILGTPHRSATAGFAVAFFTLVQPVPGWAGDTTVKHDHFLQSSTAPDLKIHVRERLPAGAEPAAIGEAVLFVHGATYGGDTFDLEIEGYDWMTQVAERGFATYYVDLRGYGHSTRPAAATQAAAAP